MTIKISGLYFQGAAHDTASTGPVEYDLSEAKRRIKTRTRNFVKYLQSQFAERYEFFPEALNEELDVVRVGDRKKRRNFDIYINYARRQVRLFGIVVAGMLHMEKLLGKLTLPNLPKWASAKVLKVSKKLIAQKLKESKKPKKLTLADLKAFEFQL